MSKLFKKVYLLLTVLVGVAISVSLVQTTTISRLTKGAAVTISFTPETANMPPNAIFKFVVDPQSQEIAFIETAISFDPNVLRLESAPIVGNSGLSLYGQMTSVQEANTTGIIEIKLLKGPSGTFPTSTFEVFTLPMTILNNAPATNTHISVVDEMTQIVSSSAQVLPFTIKTAKIAVNGKSAADKSPFPNIFNNNQRGNCGSNDYIDTAIGCIPVNNEQSLATFLLTWGLGIGGGIALVLIGFASYKIMTSQGDVQRLKEGKDLLFAAVTGLGLLVFGAFILRFIGLDVLGIF